jgi:hypothetical protein
MVHNIEFIICRIQSLENFSKLKVSQKYFQILLVKLGLKLLLH